MTISTTSRNSACVFAGAAMLSACGGSQLPIAPAAVQHAVTRSKTFVFTGKPQTFTVPSGVTQIAVAAYGAGSPSENQGPTGPIATGANGGLLKATIPVKPRERLAIFVGGQGGISVGGSRASGGFNGGAPGGRGIYDDQYADGGFGGGGASDVREGGSGFMNRVRIAAGAGGGGVGVGFYGGGAAGGGGGILGLAGGSGCLCGGPTGYGALGGSQASGGATAARAAIVAVSIPALTAATVASGAAARAAATPSIAGAAAAGEAAATMAAVAAGPARGARAESAAAAGAAVDPPTSSPARLTSKTSRGAQGPATARSSSPGNPSTPLRVTASGPPATSARTSSPGRRETARAPVGEDKPCVPIRKIRS